MEGFHLFSKYIPERECIEDNGETFLVAMTNDLEHVIEILV